MRDPPYLPIEDYGLVGNLETCVLVGRDGSVDWFPFPHLESPSVFAAVLDPGRGGHFRIGPVGADTGDQRYRTGTNVLETVFETATGTATVTDFMPPATGVDHDQQVLYRKVECRSGTADLRVEFAPRFDYDRAETTLERVDGGLRAAGGGEEVSLDAPARLDVREGRATGGVSLDAGETAWFVLRCGDAEAAADPERALADTAAFWTDWAHDCDDANECRFEGPWHDLVVRSGLVLKLLTHVETGAVAAAPTTSLPEDVGGVRNWDYRFSWLRDAGFTVQALSNLGYGEAAADYFEWFMDLCQSDDPEKLQPLYGLHGDPDLTERELDGFAGYRNSRPVRIGNGAADQTQLDIYGELVLAVDEMLRHDGALGEEGWAAVRGVVEYVREVWDQEDAGIWEVRGGNRQFVYSKVMCWLALDRAIAIAEERGREAPLEEWRDTRGTIHEEVIERGYDEDVGAFVQAYDTDALDATALLIPLVGFLPFDDDRVQSTIDAVDERLVEGERDAFVRRYDGEDGLPGDEGAFVLCSCWLVDALALSGRVEEAEERFETLTEYASPLGLFAEELDPETGTHLGNYPQAFSHIGLVNSALYLGYLQGYDLPGPEPMGIRLGEPVVE